MPISKKMNITILTPVHNEEKIVADFIKHAEAFIKNSNIKGEVLVVENGSKDNTPNILQDLRYKYKNLRVEKLKIGNKGLALKKGLEEARGEKIISLDVDLWDDDFVQKSIELLNDYDIVVGSKSLAGGGDKRSLSSRLFNKGYNFLFKFFFNFQGTETHAKLSFKKSKIMDLAKQCKTFDLTFDTELILRAERKKLSKIEIPTEIIEIRPRVYSVKAQIIRTIKNFLILLRILKPTPNWNYVLLFSALGLGLFLRFYKFKDWFYFALDEEHYAYMTRMITVNRHFPAIGGPISGTDLYLSPLFLYLNAIPYFLTNNNPLSSGFLTTLLGVIAIYLIYKIGSDFFNQRVGAIAAFLSATSFWLVLQDRHWWNISLTYFVALICLYGVWKVIKKNNYWILIIFIALTIGISAHFSNAAALLFVIAVWIIYRLPVRNKYFVFGLSFFIIAHLPLLFFDLRHNFWEFNAAKKFFTERKYDSLPIDQRLLNTSSVAAYSFARMVYIGGPTDFNQENNLCADSLLTKVSPPQWAYLLSMVFFITLLYLILGKGKNKETQLILLFLIVNFSFLAVFRADPSERHFLPSAGIFFLLIGLASDYVIRKVKYGRAAYIFIVALALINIWALLNSYASYGFKDKEEAVIKIGEMTKGEPFYLHSIGECNIWGYRYLLDFKKVTPAATYIDSTLGWMYDKQPSNVYTKEVFLFNPDPYKNDLNKTIEKIKSENKDKLIKSDRVGNIEIWVINKEQ